MLYAVHYARHQRDHAISWILSYKCILASSFRRSEPLAVFQPSPRTCGRARECGLEATVLWTIPNQTTGQLQTEPKAPQIVPVRCQNLHHYCPLQASSLHTILAADGSLLVCGPSHGCFPIRVTQINMTGRTWANCLDSRCGLFLAVRGVIMKKIGHI